MQTALKLTARVLPGKRIEFTAPERIEGEDAELIVLRFAPGMSAEAPAQPPAFASAWDWLQSLPPIERAPEAWAEIEREMQEEKNAWDN